MMISTCRSQRHIPAFVLVAALLFVAACRPVPTPEEQALSEVEGFDLPSLPEISYPCTPEYPTRKIMRQMEDLGPGYISDQIILTGKQERYTCFSSFLSPPPSRACVFVWVLFKKTQKFFFKKKMFFFFLNPI